LQFSRIKNTPAKALGIADRVCTIGELIDAARAHVPPNLGRRRKKPNKTEFASV
jgi:hypothetical protein